ncbi:MAG: O-methyltransferase [Chloroflexota bacterium]|nr:O-methyltransferase [Chloroflexota bacterium]
MSQNSDIWIDVDDYLSKLFAPDDPILTAALEAADEARLPAIQVSAVQGKLLHLLAKSHNARTILEIGTLGGYSTIWLARALPADGKLITLELNPAFAAVARANLERAGLAERTEVRVGAAIDSLPQLAQEGLPPFDLVFIDADKVNTPAYLDWSLRMTRPGSLIIIDNVIREGNVIDAASTDASVQGVRAALAALASNPRLLVTAMQTVGSKGYDGMAMALIMG